MTSMDSHDQPDGAGRVKQPAAAVARGAQSAGPDPVHPKLSALSTAHSPAHSHGHAHATIAERAAQLRHSRAEEARTEPPLAADLGTPAVLLNQVVALEVGSCPCPVGIHRWAGDGVSTILLTPTQAQVWARAGRLTLVSAEGDEYRLTVLAPEEGATATLGAHWPLREASGRVRRIASAAAHDVGELLTFPAWLARTAHISGERNQQLARLVNRIRVGSPVTVVHYGQTFGHEHPAGPKQLHPYDHKGLVGHEGWPHEL